MLRVRVRFILDQFAGCRCPVCHSRSTIPYESHSTQAWDNFVLCQPVYAVNWRLGKQLDELKPRQH